MTTNLTVRIDTGTKKEFDIFCENVGINATAAVNMFIKTVVRTRTLPFVITDSNAAQTPDNKILMANMKNAIQSMREQSATIGNDKMTIDDINAEISAYRQEKRSNA